MKTVAGPADHLRPLQDWRHREPTAAIRRAGLAWAPPPAVSTDGTCETFGRLIADNLARIDELDAAVMIPIKDPAIAVGGKWRVGATVSHRLSPIDETEAGQ